MFVADLGSHNVRNTNTVTVQRNNNREKECVRVVVFATLGKRLAPVFVFTTPTADNKHQCAADSNDIASPYTILPI